MSPTFAEIWSVFSTGRGRIIGLDAISLSVVFRIAEKQLRGETASAQSMRNGLLEHEPRVIGQPIISEQLDVLIEEIKKNTRFDGTMVFNADGRRRYENLANVGFMISDNGFQTIVMTQSGVELV